MGTHWSGLSRRISGRLRWWAHWRCVEPVLVIESDDWGLARQPCADILQAFGSPKIWAEEASETPEDLARLYAVLESHRDVTGRPACFTANFVVARPDFEAIEHSNFKRYHEKSVGQDANLVTAWRDGIRRGVFFPQYHGRTHFWPETWLQDLREGHPVARTLFERRLFGGPFLLQGEGLGYRTEYLCWSTGEIRSTAQNLAWVQKGVEIFRRLFGYLPRSSIAPHYVLPASIAEVWARVGIRYVQGAGYRILRRPTGGQHVLSHVLGERISPGLLCLIRTVKFEPCRNHPPWGVKAAIKRIETCFRTGLPAILDSHRINYTGHFRDQGLEALDQLLSAVAAMGARFLTSVELGEAIAEEGRYHDWWYGERRNITPRESLGQTNLRRCLARLHAHVGG